MDFKETLTVMLPDLGERLDSFLEHRSPLEKGLVIEVAAIHEGMTANFNNYPATELAAALPSWTSPYPKPVLLHHDPFSEPMGRIIGARMDKEDDGTPYVRLQVAVTDSAAIQKVKDQRYLTGSVGGKAGKASCTICNADWSKASMFELPCKHQRGKTYQGKLASIEMADITFKEYSFVNMPADQKSGVRAVHQPMENESEEDFRPARFFCLDMQHEAITEFGESERNVLGALRAQEASALYLGLKASFLSALAEDSKEENVGTERQQDAELPPEVTEEEEDVLAVAEGLSSDLAQTSEDGDAEGDEESAEEGDEETPAEASGEGEESSEESGEEPPAAEGSEEPNEPAAGDEGGEGDEGDGEGDSEEPPAAAEEESEEAEASDTEGDDSTEENKPEPQVAELQAQIDNLNAEALRLTEENMRLKAALKRGLAERVVDMKIALGYQELEEREEQLTEHLTRSASSLADSLRDLSSMQRLDPSYSDIPKVKPTAVVAGGDEREPVVELVPNEKKSPKPTDPEEIFVDVLMGRRPL